MYFAQVKKGCDIDMYNDEYVCDDRLDTVSYMKFLANMSDEEFDDYQRQRKHLSDKEKYEEAVRIFPADKKINQ